MYAAYIYHGFVWEPQEGCWGSDDDIVAFGLLGICLKTREAEKGGGGGEEPHSEDIGGGDG